jgi:hypothetical protein
MGAPRSSQHLKDLAETSQARLMERSPGSPERAGFACSGVEAPSAAGFLGSARSQKLVAGLQITQLPNYPFTQWGSSQHLKDLAKTSQARLMERSRPRLRGPQALLFRSPDHPITDHPMQSTDQPITDHPMGCSSDHQISRPQITRWGAPPFIPTSKGLSENIPSKAYGAQPPSAAGPSGFALQITRSADRQITR